MKFRWFTLSLLILSIALTACGGGDSGSGEPVDVVKNVVEAMESLDFDKASEYMCAEQGDALKADMESGFAELEEMGMDPDELMDAFKLKMSDVEYEEKSKDDNNAVVHVSGKVALDFDTDKLKSFFKKAAEASGEEVSDEEIDMMVGMFTAMGGQESPFEGDVELIKEDGDWVVCDELDFLDEVDIGF